MVQHSLNDTIAAVGTASGSSGIGIIKISGQDALSVAEKIFISKDKKLPSTYKTYSVHYGWVVDRKMTSTVNSPPSIDLQKKNSQPQGIIDEVLLTVMRSPKSYTKEDVVEFNCHGGVVATRKVLELALENGCRLAEPGEFTRRAFLNGRIDLAQAESVLDIIKAKTDSALRLGIEQLKGALSKQLNQMRSSLLNVLSVLEANIDFPDEQVGSVNIPDISEQLNSLNAKLSCLLDTAGRGKVLREGIHVVICGKPNAGKSSLLNALLKQERSIVTPIAGTTRDAIEEIIDIRGIPVKIVDTAGIIEPRDLIERKAMQRSRKQIALADLVILLLDNSCKLEKEDMLLMKRLVKKKVIAVVNKIDLRTKIEKGLIFKKFGNLVEISAKKSKNIDKLEEQIVNVVLRGEVESKGEAVVSNLRHIEAIKRAKKLVAQSLCSLDNNLSLEFIAEDIKGALNCLDEVLGKSFTGELLNRIFEEFCIGK